MLSAIARSFKQSALEGMWQGAFELNSRNIAELARGLGASRMIDLGCGDGKVTRLVAEALDPKQIDVVEVYQPHVEAAKAHGWNVHEYNLNGPLDVPSGAYDVVLSNQVIEHLYDTDLFVSEVYRITRPGGMAIISTENAASWHNIIALILGWQSFSLTNVSAIRSGLGNPMALHAHEVGASFLMQHHRIFSLRGLCDLMVAHGFTHLRTRGSGYYPLPASFGNVNRSHAHFITASGRKPAACAEVLGTPPSERREEVYGGRSRSDNAASTTASVPSR